MATRASVARKKAGWEKAKLELASASANAKSRKKKDVEREWENYLNEGTKLLQQKGIGGEEGLLVTDAIILGLSSKGSGGASSSGGGMTRPASTETFKASEAGGGAPSSMGPVIGIGVALLALGGIAVFLKRRKASSRRNSRVKA